MNRTFHIPQPKATHCPAGAVLIGVSTGGPRALEAILPALPADLPWPVVVAQHMPANFTAGLAARLDQHCALHVVEAAQAMPLLAGQIYLARGGCDVTLFHHGSEICVAPCAVDPALFWHPSVDLLVRSAMQVFPAEALIGVLLTGMGDDGAAAMTELRQQGGRTLAESAESAVVFGMPAELIRRGGAAEVAHLQEIAGVLKRWLPHRHCDPALLNP
jgi:two-component system chemotaxis response regulator CheB